MTAITTTFDQLARGASVRAQAAADRRARRVPVTASLLLTFRAAGVLLRAYLTVILSLAGVGSLVYAGFTLGLTIGFAVLGVAFLVLAFYAESERRP